jgi:hypothetical protein
MIDISESIKDNNKVNISATTSVYTWNESSKIKYYIWDNENEWWEIIIDKNSNISFKEKITIISINWSAYIKSKNTINLVWNEIKKYLWLPLFEWTNFNISSDLQLWLNSHSSHIIIQHSWEDELSINFSDTNSYFYYNLWTKSSDYLVRLSTPNDFFYWKINAILWKTIWTYSKQILFSPQIEADNIAPELNVSYLDSNWKIRIPVYQKKIINLSNAIYENSWISGVKNIKIDFDLENDSDWDWNNKNDNDADNINIIQTLTNIDIEFWKYNTLFEKKIWIILEDTNWNKSFNEVQFEVYSPTPQIDNNIWNRNEWKIDEELIWEPINIYRIRSWNIKRLENKNDKIKVDTVEEWIFNFEVKDDEDWLILENNNLEIAKINENTWNIILKNSNYLVKIKNDESGFPKIVIEEWTEIEIYSQKIKLTKNKDIYIVNNFDNLEEKGLYLNLINKSQYNFYKIPDLAEYSAWAIVIYKQNDLNKKEVFTIFPDWRIKYNDIKYKLKYFSNWENMWFELVSRIWNNTIWKLLYNIDWSYLMK